jgi:predicted GNAT superfamily acetyltransferase
MAELHVHPLVTMEALRACERLQLEVWRFAEIEVVPAAQMRAALHGGALVAGAFVGREMIGFLYGFPALPHEAGLPGVGMHSHMLAVLPEARGLGAGRALKWYQRHWCLEHGMRWVAWTYDPLQARNARLNLEHLGTVVHEYQVDFYGVLGGELSGAFPTDRFVALWWLDHERVGRRAARDPAARVVPGPRSRGDMTADALATPTPVAPSPAAARTWILEADGSGGPGAAPVASAPVVWLAAPADINRLRATDPARALAWREAYKDVVPSWLARGYEVRGFMDGSYVLADRHLSPPDE